MGNDHKHDSKSHSHDGCDHQDQKHSRDHSHDHGHSHSGHHHHGVGHHHHHVAKPGESPERVIRGLKIAFFLNISFSIFEFIGGYLTNSVAVMSDALHDLGDAVALGMAWWFEKKSIQKATGEYTYGFRRFSLLSSVGTGAILLVGSLFIIRESIARILSPEPVIAWGMIVMAMIGIAVNGWSLRQFSSQGGANERMIRLHLIEDVAGWIVLLFTGIIMQFVDWPWLDAVVAIGISLWILQNVVRQLIAVSQIFLQALPKGVSLPAIEIFLRSVDGVEDCHHTHIWSLDGEKHILTTHIRVAAGTPVESLTLIKAALKNGLQEKFAIFEATVEFEFAGEECQVPNH
jgi:cobalt-zinc-cadmium efflux system protein